MRCVGAGTPPGAGNSRACRRRLPRAPAHARLAGVGPSAPSRGRSLPGPVQEPVQTMTRRPGEWASVPGAPVRQDVVNALRCKRPTGSCVAWPVSRGHASTSHHSVNRVPSGDLARASGAARRADLLRHAPAIGRNTRGTRKSPATRGTCRDRVSPSRASAPLGTERTGRCPSAEPGSGGCVRPSCRTAFRHFGTRSFPCLPVAG